LIPAFKVGEQVFKPGTPLSRFVVLQELPRRGTVTKTYYGAPTATSKGIPLMDVRFDDGEERTGFINMVGVFTTPPIFLPAMWVVSDEDRGKR
jgi:hypothetical protein